MGADLTTIGGLFKTKYVGPVHENLTNGTVLLDKFQKDSETYDGEAVVLNVNKGRNVGQGAAAEDGTLPTAGNQGYAKLTYTLKYVYSRVRLTGQTIKLSRTNLGAFAKAMEREFKGATRDARNELNRMLNGAGDEILTLVNGTSGAATVITVDSTRFLNDGDLLKIGTDDVTVVTVDSDTQITITPSTTVADNDTIKRRIGTSTVDEPNGIALMIDDAGTVGGLARSSNNWLNSKVIDNSGTNRDLTIALMDQLTREVEKRKNAQPDAFFAKQELRDVYGQLLQADRRFMSKDLLGGKEALSHNGVPFLVDFHAKDYTIFAPTWDTMTLYDAGPVEFMDEDGNVLSRVADKDAFEATLRYYCQLGTHDARINARLEDVSETLAA